MIKLLLLAIVFLSRTSSTLTTNVSSVYRSKRDDGILEDPDKDQYGIFMGRIEVNSTTFPAVIVSGICAVASAELKASWTGRKMCMGLSTRHRKCVTIHDCKVKDDLAFLKMPLTASYSRGVEPLINSGAIEKGDCVAVCYLHEILKVKYLHESNEVQCARCNFLDALFCDYQMVGVLGKGSGGKFPILWYTALHKLSMEIMGDDASSKTWNTFDRKRMKGMVDAAIILSPCAEAIVGAVSLIMLFMYKLHVPISLH